MPLWFLIVGGVLAFIAGRSSSTPPTPSIGRALPAPRSTPVVKRHGQRATFELGAPYAIVATATVPSAELARLKRLLELGTWHARNVQFRQTGGLTTVSLCFIAPKTASVPIGQPLDWDLGDGRFRLVLREVHRLDGRSC